MYQTIQTLIEHIKSELDRTDINEAYRKTLQATMENLYTLSMFN